jgi:integrase
MDEISDLSREVERLRIEVDALRRTAPIGASVTDFSHSAGSSCGVDTKTRYQGVYARHRRNCPKTLDKGSRCRCRPSYYGKVWDPAIGRHRRTERRSSLREAKVLRVQLFGRVSGLVPARVSLGEAKDQFLADCRAGVALNRRGEPYRPKAIANLASSLKSLPVSIVRKPFGDVAGWDLQLAVDGYRRRDLSSSRIHSIICAVRSLYAWGIQRGMAARSPAAKLRLPLVRSRPRTRIAKPGEFAELLEALALRDALPWALAAYGTARLQEIQVLRWEEVDFEKRALLLAEDLRGRKSEAAHRVVPMVDQLRGRLRAEWVGQGEPVTGRICPPRHRSSSGMLSLGQLSKNVAPIWREQGLEPIGLQDSRHTAATWLDHAGVSPKVASALMGHRMPSPDLVIGAAPITLRTYTHVLEGELDRARDLLQAFLDERKTG